MRKISVKALRRILSDDYFQSVKDDDAEEREQEFRKMYLVRDATEHIKQWNDQAKKLRKEYIEFLTSLKAYPAVSKESESGICKEARIKLKVNDCQYGARIDLPRVYVYGFPREFRRLIEDKQVRKIQAFERVLYEIDVTEVGKTVKVRLTLSEGYATSSRRFRQRKGGTYHTKGTVQKTELTQDGKWSSMREEVIPPEHIPDEQKYLWVMLHLSDEDNFKQRIVKMFKGSISCCGTLLASYNAKIYFCPVCGSNIKEKFGELVFSNFRVIKLISEFLFSEVVLKLEDAPCNYVTTKRTRRSNTPVF